MVARWWLLIAVIMDFDAVGQAMELLAKKDFHAPCC